MNLSPPAKWMISTRMVLKFPEITKEQKDRLFQRFCNEIEHERAMHPPGLPAFANSSIQAIFDSLHSILQSRDDLLDEPQGKAARAFIGYKIEYVIRMLQAFKRAVIDAIFPSIPREEAKVEYCHSLDEALSQLLWQVLDLAQNSHKRAPEGEADKPGSDDLALLSRHSLFYNAFQHSTDGIIITDLEGRIMEANQAFLDIYGFNYDEVIGQRTNIIRSPETPESFYQEMWHAINTRGEWKGEITNRRKDGLQIPVWVSITPIYHEGKKSGYMSVQIDISEKKKMEHELIKEKKFSESLIETANSLIVALDLAGKITLFNRKLEQVTGYTKQEVLGNSWFELFIPENLRPEVSEVFETIKRGDLPSHYENPILTKEGKERLISWSNTAIHNENHEIVGALAIGQDVTDQKRLERQIIQSERLSIIGQMAAKVAHEIRNPLSSISLNAELLEDEVRMAGDAISSEADTLLRSIMAEVDRVATLTDEYLQFSRMPEADPACRALTPVVADVLDFIEPQANSVGIQIIRRFAPDLPKIVFDSQQIRQVLLNVVKNAIEAMKNGGILKVSVQQEDEHLRIDISDSGGGIPEEARDKIFEPFYTTKDLGTGLGLATSQQMIQEHGGKIKFTSISGVGTIFHIYLPTDGDKKRRSSKRGG